MTSFLGLTGLRSNADFIANMLAELCLSAETPRERPFLCFPAASGSPSFLTHRSFLYLQNQPHLTTLFPYHRKDRFYVQGLVPLGLAHVNNLGVISLAQCVTLITSTESGLFCMRTHLWGLRIRIWT